VELSSEAIRLARELFKLLPDEGEVAGLLALLLLTDARKLARTDAAGKLVPLREQDRRLWDAPNDRRGPRHHPGGAGEQAGRALPGAGGDCGGPR
jgi:predicted RNA polymerase sigma factor